MTDNTMVDAASMQVVDRMLGAIFGHAIGDAVGIPSEYTVGKQKWPDSQGHRGFPANDWSEKTDHMILIMQTLLDPPADTSTPSWERTEFARRLVKWSQLGLTECGDNKPAGVGGAICAVMMDPHFLTDPMMSAATVWDRSNQVMCTSSHMSRSVPVGFVSDRKTVKALSASFSAVTHVDPRARTAAEIYALIINGLVYTDDNAHTVLAKACSDAIAGDTNDSSSVSDATRDGFTKSLSSLDLNGNGSSSALRALSVAAYTLQIIASAEASGTTPSFDKVVRAIAAQGGCASVNAGIAGSIIGAALGYSRIPSDLIDAMPYHGYLPEIASRYVAAVKK